MGRSDLAEQATEGMLGPNPFVGLRTEDIVASFGPSVEQAIRNPTLVVEQEAALIRDLIAVMSGQSQPCPTEGRQNALPIRPWQESPLYRMVHARLCRPGPTRCKVLSIDRRSMTGPRAGRASRFRS